LFAGKAVRLQLHALASNSATSYARRATPEHIKDRLLPASRRNCIEIGANAVSHGRKPPLRLGSGLIDHSQKMTAAAMQIAEK
jgi:hypothetical protein